MVGVGEYISIRLKPAVNLSVFVTHTTIDAANVKNNIYDKINYLLIVPFFCDRSLRSSATNAHKRYHQKNWEDCCGKKPTLYVVVGRIGAKSDKGRA